VQSKKENDNILKMPGKKLLVADDSLTIQKVIRLSLSNEGYEIQAVSQCSEAIEEIALFLPDLVLIDVSLPEQSAFEVKRIVNEDPRFAQVRFILMSSAFEQVDENQVENLGFHGHLTKPFDPAHLRKILTAALQQEIPPPVPELPPLPPEQPPPMPSEDTLLKILTESTLNPTV
jgi:CheY-like chemotaxis protein